MKTVKIFEHWSVFATCVLVMKFHNIWIFSDCRSFYLADRHSLVSLRAFLCEQCELELEKSKGLYVYDFFFARHAAFKTNRP